MGLDGDLAKESFLAPLKLEVGGAVPLLKALKQFRAFCDALTVAAGYMDQHHVCRFANRAFAQTFRKDSCEIEGCSVFEFLSGEALEMALKNHARVLAGETLELETWVPGILGESRNYRLSYIPDRDSTGKVIGFLVLATDQTEVLRSKSKTSELHQAAAMLSRAADLSAVRAAIETKVLRMFGSDRGLMVELLEDRETLEMTGVWRYPPELTEGWKRFPVSVPLPVPQAARTGLPVYVESREEMQQNFPFLASVKTLESTHALVAIPMVVRSQVIGVIGLSYDSPRSFTEQTRQFMQTMASHCGEAIQRAKLFERIQATQEQLSLAIESSELGIWDWNPIQGVLQWSEKLQQLYGLKPGEFKGTFEHYQELLYPEDRAFVRATVDHAIREKKPFEMVHRVLWPDGSTHWVQGRGKPHFDESGTLVRITGTSVNIDAKVRSEEAIRTANEQLEQAVKARQELMNVCGHELKTPLSSLKLQTQAAQRRIAKGDDSVFAPTRVQKLIDGYAKQIDRLVHLVDDMLDVTRISAGRLSLNLENVSLSRLVLEVLDLHGDQIHRAGCQIHTQLASFVKGSWDRFRIEQVFANLLTNALKYGKGKPITVTVEHSEDGRWAILSVRDEGMGIAPEHQARIFDRFERAVSSDEVSGLGLGLYITREIVGLHKGTISVESDLQRGARFVVRLPLEHQTV
jgi:PAS domain S-box-containing protein